MKDKRHGAPRPPSGPAPSDPTKNNGQTPRPTLPEAESPRALPAEQIMGRMSPRSMAVVSQNWPKPGVPPRKALVMGLGLSGLASAKLLVRLGFEVIASERRMVAQLGPEAKEMDAIGVNLIDE
ncbi:MAG: hypothetical protein LBJ61_09080, partial [Deltaproteobacteria bacterium]|nr:hypothetical protein [Deltaproteobacteria bacterium]